MIKLKQAACDNPVTGALKMVRLSDKIAGGMEVSI
jgi:hypothetical protein